MNKFCKVLLVHADENTQEILKEKIKDHGVSVNSMASGIDGFITARIERFDLIVCAIDLPVMSGLEMVRSIHQQTLNQDVPVVFIGAPGHPEWLPLPGRDRARVLTAEEFVEEDFEKSFAGNRVR